MSVLNAVLLGLLQGFTEFLPVSSSGHLVIAQNLIGDFEQPGVLFDVVLHFGTLLATVLYFRKHLIDITVSFFNNSKGGKKYGLLIIVGSIPTALIGLTFKSSFETMFGSLKLVGVMLVVTGTILFLTRKIVGKKSDLTFVDAIIIGTVQGFAITPGISRSGITISTGLFRDIDGEASGRFSFMLSIPAILGAVVIEGRHLTTLNTENILSYVAGAIAAFLAGYISIKFLMTLLRSTKFSYFSYYCFAAGIVVIFVI